MKVYFEAGANDGKFQSRTWKYRDDSNWFGILVEPDPRCWKGLDKNRANKNTHIIKCALVPEKSMTEINLYQHGAPAMNMVEGSKKLKYDGGSIKPIKVPGKTLQEVLDSLPVEKVDEFYLDVEGFEIQVLKGLHSFPIEFAEIEVHLSRDPELYRQQIGGIKTEMDRLGLDFTKELFGDGNLKLLFKKREPKS